VNAPLTIEDETRIRFLHARGVYDPRGDDVAALLAELNRLRMALGRYQCPVCGEDELPCDCEGVPERMTR
jgi:hypothetical protein